MAPPGSTLLTVETRPIPARNVVGKAPERSTTCVIGSPTDSIDLRKVWRGGSVCVAINGKGSGRPPLAEVALAGDDGQQP